MKPSFRANGITGFEFAPGLGATPARVNTGTGVIQWNPEWWFALKHVPHARAFINLHEMGHILEKTSSEEQADKFAWRHYKRLGYPPEDSLPALVGVLNAERPDHLKRMCNQYKRVLHELYRTKNNKKAWKTLQELNKLPCLM